ncbi:unnamed protein product [Trichobilharzia regenti]|nr:unnamed protein product [Trichobilharzia regenti]
MLISICCFFSARTPGNINLGTGGASGGSVGEEQLQLLYQQLDDKDDEINKQAQTIARLRQQIEEQDVVNNSLRIEREGQLKEITTLQVSGSTCCELYINLYIHGSVLKGDTF